MILVRPVRPGDVPFITSNWLRCVRNSPWVKGCPNSMYYNYHHRLLDHILPRATTLLAVNEKNDNELLGFATGEFLDEQVFVLHFVYVKDHFRLLGVAGKLLEAFLLNSNPAIKLYTAKTRDIYPIEDKLADRGYIYNPYLLFMNLPQDWYERLGQPLAEKLKGLEDDKKFYSEIDKTRPNRKQNGVIVDRGNGRHEVLQDDGTSVPIDSVTQD